jgi:hypothetical protein
MAAFRAQQERWVRGAGEVLRRLWQPLGRDRDRVGFFSHLLRHVRQPVIALLALWLPALCFGKITPLLPIPHLWSAVCALLVGSVALYLGAGQKRRGSSFGAAALLSPFVVALSAGLSLALSLSIARGLIGRPAEFVRTPKVGDRPADRASYRAPTNPLGWVELGVGISNLAAAISVGRAGDFASAFGLAFFFAFGFFWVGGGSLR